MTQLQVRLYRDSFTTPWGFRLQGGRDIGPPLTIQRVFSNSPAEGELQRGDRILSIGGRPGSEVTHQQAQDIIRRPAGQIDVVVQRPAPSHVSTTATFTPAAQRPRAHSLQQPPRQQPVTMPVSHGGFTPKKVTLSRLGGGGPEFGSDFTRYRPSSSVTQPVHVHTGGRGPQYGSDMTMNRMQDSMDSLSLSPRTPDLGYQAPPFAGGSQYIPTGVRLDMEREQELRQQQMQQQQQQPQYHQQHYQSAPEPAQQQQYYFEPQQSYVPTGVRLDHQMGEVDEQGGIQPVWERRRTFMNAPAKPAPAPTGKNTAPKVLKPKSGSSGFSFGVDYSKPAPKTSTVTWRPQPVQRPVNAAPAHPEVFHPSPAPWSAQVQHQDEPDEPDAPPAWRTSLKTTGVKPWDMDVDYSSQQQQPPPARGNVQVQNPDKPGDRDWTQSAVYRMIYEEEKRGRPGPQQQQQQQQQQQPYKPPPPPPAPKPQTQTFQQAFNPMDGDFGTSDF